MTTPTPSALDALRRALERVTTNYRLTLAGKPVRDVAETLAECDAAIAAAEAAEPAPRDSLEALRDMLRAEVDRLIAARPADSAAQVSGEATSDQILGLAEALEVRRILEEIKKVAAIHPAADMPTPFQAAWQACCEEVFYRATGEQWHMDEDATRFERPAARAALTPPPAPAAQATYRRVGHVRIDGEELHLFPATRDPDAAGLVDGQPVFALAATPAVKESLTPPAAPAEGSGT